jgi:hypothetical protein
MHVFSLSTPLSLLAMLGPPAPLAPHFSTQATAPSPPPRPDSSGTLSTSAARAGKHAKCDEDIGAAESVRKRWVSKRVLRRTQTTLWGSRAPVPSRGNQFRSATSLTRVVGHYSVRAADGELCCTPLWLTAVHTRRRRHACHARPSRCTREARRGACQRALSFTCRAEPAQGSSVYKQEQPQFVLFHRSYQRILIHANARQFTACTSNPWPAARSCSLHRCVSADGECVQRGAELCRSVVNGAHGYILVPYACGLK